MHPLIIAGIVAGVVVVVLAISFVVSLAVFQAKVHREVKQLFTQAVHKTGAVITEADLGELPEPVRRYLLYVGVVGTERITSVRMRQENLFRQEEDSDWMPMSAEQYYVTDTPGFLWHANMRLFRLPLIKGIDRFYQGRGNMLIKFLPFITIADARGHEIDQGTLVRYLQEMMWFPTAYLNDYIRWDPIDSRSAQATITVDDLTASAVLYFDEEGRMTDFIAERYMSADDEFQLETWSTPMQEYKNMDGLLVPTRGVGVWKLSSGDFSYIKLEVTDIEYNSTSVY